jgi:GNAT superfamily N-acetyltransferase
MTNNCYEKVEEFVQSVYRGSWISMSAGGVELIAYMRKGSHVCDRAILPTLDIATVTSIPQRQGGFTALLEAAEQVAAKYGRVVYVENVHLYRVDRFLSNRGYARKGTFPAYAFYQTQNAVSPEVPPTAAEVPTNDIRG